MPEFREPMMGELWLWDDEVIVIPLRHIPHIPGPRDEAFIPGTIWDCMTIDLACQRRGNTVLPAILEWEWIDESWCRAGWKLLALADSRSSERHLQMTDGGHIIPDRDVPRMNVE